MTFVKLLAFTLVVFNYHCFLFVDASNKENKSPPPNVIFLLMDDLGFSDVGWTSLPNDIDNNFVFSTPNLDKLAKNGIRMNYHYSAPICSPSRSSFLSGKYDYKTGVANVIQPHTNVHLLTSFKLISDIFKENNYATLISGKYHAGYQFEDQLPFNRGFDECLFFMFGINYYTHKRCNPWRYFDSAPNAGDNLNENIIEQRNNLYGDAGLCGYDLFDENYDTIFDQTTYLERMFTDKIIHFIQQHNKQPYFVYYAMKTPHSPYQLPPITYIKECQHITEEARNILCQMMLYQDELIGEILDIIDDNTIIIFASDNGGVSAGQNLPLRGAKGGPFEGGIRSVSFISGPYFTNNIVDNDIGCDYNKIAFIGDWYPTMLDMVGIHYVNKDIDGRSLYKDIMKTCSDSFTKTFFKKIKKNLKGPRKSRNKIVRMGLCNNNGSVGHINIDDSYFFASYIRQNEWKLIVNGSVGRCSTANHGDSRINSYKNLFDNSFELIPNQEVYSKYMQSDNDVLYRSKLYDELNDEQRNDENNFLYAEFMLFNIYDDPIESTNLANEHPSVVNKLFNKLIREKKNYISRDRQPPLPISVLAQIENYNCELETNFVRSWADNPLYSDESFNDWNPVWQTAIDVMEQC